MLLTSLILVAGFILLIKGAGWLVDGASALAKKYRVPDLVIGLTIVAFGTSAPELIVTVIAAFDGYDAIVFGNVIGSNNFNLFVILGISGLIIPLAVHSGTVWKEIPFSLMAAIMLLLFAGGFTFGSGTVSRIEGIMLLACFVAFLILIFWQLRSDPTKVDVTTKAKSGSMIALMIGFGLAGLIAGGKLVVDSAVKIAEALGVSQKVIGLTIVAVGTSLPELATSVVAAIRKNADIAVGNIIGSNIFNIFLIVGVSAVIRPLNFDPSFYKDLLMLCAGTIILFIAMFVGKKHKLDRWEAALLLLAFVVYMSVLLR